MDKSRQSTSMTPWLFKGSANRKWWPNQGESAMRVTQGYVMGWAIAVGAATRWHAHTAPSFAEFVTKLPAAERVRKRRIPPVLARGAD